MLREEVEMIEEVKCSPIIATKNKDELTNCSFTEDTPPAKKLKQARLPFAILDSKSNSQKKRKLSEDESCCRSTKTARNEDAKILLQKPTEDLDLLADSTIEQVEDDVLICSSETENIPKLESPKKLASEKSKAIMRNFICKSLQEVKSFVKDSESDAKDSSNAVLTNKDNSDVISEDKANEDKDSNNESSSSIETSDEKSEEEAEEEDDDDDDEEASSSKLESSVEGNASQNSSFMNDCEEIILSSDNCSTPIKPEDDNKHLLKKKNTQHTTIEEKKAQEEKEKADGSNNSAQKKKIKRRSIEEKKKLDEEKELKKLEKEKLKEERRKAKEQKLLESAKKRKEREAKLKEKQEMKEKLQKEKNERKDKLEKEKLEKLKLKEEERKKKQELLEAKLEEKKKKELEKSLKDEEVQRKQAKTKLAFVNFFVKKDVTPSFAMNDEDGLFKPFQVRENMRLAPVCRVDLDVSRRSYLDESLINQDCLISYLKQLQSGNYHPGKCRETWPLSEINEDDDQEVIEIDTDDVCADTRQEQKRPRAKLFQFHENVRPPYWGTWQKISKTVRPRNPFGRDVKFFDYEVDSDEEWEEEEPGESLSSTEDEKESEDEYEVDNDVFVPHGYLSEEEASEDENVSPDIQKAKLKQKELEFEEERKKKCKQIKPLVIGCIWLENEKSGLNDVQKLLDTFKAVFMVSTPLATSYSTDVLSSKANPDGDGGITVSEDNCQGSSSKRPKRPVPENALPFLIQLIHGNRKSRITLQKEFLEFWRLHNLNSNKLQVEKEHSEKNITGNESSPEASSKSLISKRQLELTFQKIAVWKRFPEPGPIYNKVCWYVHPEFREKYAVENIPLPNQWKYVTKDDTSSPGSQQSSIGSVINKIKNNSKESLPTSDEILSSQTTLKDSLIETQNVISVQNQPGKISGNVEKNQNDVSLESIAISEVPSSSKPKLSIKHFFTKPKNEITVPATSKRKAEPIESNENKVNDDFKLSQNENNSNIVVVDYAEFQQDVKQLSLPERTTQQEIGNIKNSEQDCEEDKLNSINDDRELKNELPDAQKEKKIAVLTTSEMESQVTENKLHLMNESSNKIKKDVNVELEDSSSIEVVFVKDKC